ncbi:MAG: hypothetical protein DCF15_21590 [Phormidesmis priestleyi]|uniref:Uncharacterized protein n=1 Tax=Phormidesmis priestleyi TaxID=268141 RepID=A0A2W4WJV2_9CYAN|nr:MAG: hypothetical protein DCF15_21590 [Phormidesmis priestleyi]
MESLRRDRCQGALLGLWLAPTAIRTLNISGDRPANRPVNLPLAPDMAADMAAVAALSLAQVNHFTASPSTFHTRPWPKALPYWLFSLPVLLRYHDSWQQRLQWVYMHLSSLDSLTKADAKINSIAISQSLLLGDLLQIALRCEGNSTDLGCVGQGQRWQFWQNHLSLLAERAQAYNLISGQTLSYQTLLTHLNQAFTNQAFTFAEASPLAAADQIWVQALAAALSQPQSYSLTARQLAYWGDRTALVAPLMSGALQGQAALPVLCQLRSAPLHSEHLEHFEFRHQLPGRATLLAAANRLVDQWAGILPAADSNSATDRVRNLHTIIAK